MAIFIGFIVFLGIRMSGNDDSIEEDDYYAKGQKYEEQIAKERNTETLHALPILNYDPKSGFSVSMPDKSFVTEAKLLLYKPDASNKDRNIDVSALKSASQIVSDVKLEKGKWIAKFDWSAEGKDYYLEKEFFVD